MAVTIPIGADAAAVAKSIDDIRTAIQRAGQDGKAFAAIDFSHPELSAMAADIQKVHQQLLDIQKFGAGSTAAGVRAINPADPLDWHSRIGQRYLDPKDAARHAALVGSHVFSGTQFAVPPQSTPAVPVPSPQPAPNYPSPAAPPKPLADKQPTLTSVLDTMGPAIKGALGFIGVTSVAAMIDRTGRQATDEAIGNDGLMRHMDGATTDFEALRTAVRATSDALGLTIADTQRLSASWGRLTGDTNSVSVQDNVKFAAGVARGYGMDPGTMTAALGRAANAGEDPRTMAMLMGETAREGGMQGKTEQVLQTLVQWTETQSRLLVDHSNVAQFAGAYAFLNNTNQPGLRGDNATGLLTTIDAAVRNGGANGGDAGRALVQRALAKNGITDPYAQQRALEGGMFESTNGMSNYSMIMGEFNKEYAGASPDQKSSARARLLGLNMRQGDAIAAHWNDTDVLKGVDFLKKADIDPASLSANGLRDVGDVLGANAGGLEDWRKKLMARGDTQSDTAKLAGMSGDALREGLVRIIGQHGMEKDDGTRAADAASHFSNALTEAGTALVPVFTGLKEGAAAAGGALSVLSTKLADAIQMFRDNAGVTYDKDGNALDANGNVPVPNLPRSPSGGSWLKSGWDWVVGGRGKGDQSGAPTATGSMSGAEIMAHMEGNGFTAAQAAAVAANVLRESGGNPNSSITDTDGLNHRGLLQWSPDRQANFKKWANGLDISRATGNQQLDFLHYEMTQGQEKNRAKAFWADTNAHDAAEDLSLDVIRPGNSVYEARTRGDTADGYMRRVHPVPNAAAGGTPPGGAATINHTYAPLEVTVKQAGVPDHTQHLPVEGTSNGQPAPYNAPVAAADPKLGRSYY